MLRGRRSLLHANMRESFRFLISLMIGLGGPASAFAVPQIVQIGDAVATDCFNLLPKIGNLLFRGIRDETSILDTLKFQEDHADHAMGAAEVLFDTHANDQLQKDPGALIRDDLLKKGWQLTQASNLGGDLGSSIERYERQVMGRDHVDKLEVFIHAKLDAGSFYPFQDRRKISSPINLRSLRIVSSDRDALWEILADPRILHANPLSNHLSWAQFPDWSRETDDSYARTFSENAMAELKKTGGSHKPNPFFEMMLLGRRPVNESDARDLASFLKNHANRPGSSFHFSMIFKEDVDRGISARKRGQEFFKRWADYIEQVIEVGEFSDPHNPANRGFLFLAFTVNQRVVLPALADKSYFFFSRAFPMGLLHTSLSGQTVSLSNSKMGTLTISLDSGPSMPWVITPTYSSGYKAENLVLHQNASRIERFDRNGVSKKMVSAHRKFLYIGSRFKEDPSHIYGAGFHVVDNYLNSPTFEGKTFLGYYLISEVQLSRTRVLKLGEPLIFSSSAERHFAPKPFAIIEDINDPTRAVVYESED